MSGILSVTTRSIPRNVLRISAKSLEGNSSQVIIYLNEKMCYKSYDFERCIM